MLALVTDLIFATKISSTAKATEADVKIVRSLERLDEQLLLGNHRTILIDLDADGVDVLQAIKSCRAAVQPPRIIAYVSHVETELIQCARAAGAHVIMARSAFVTKLPSLLSEGNQP